MRAEDPDAIAARILAAARRAPGGVVATDADGTLWSGDVGDDLFFALLDAGAIEPPAAEAFSRAALAHGVDASGSAADVGRRLYAAFEGGLVPEEAMFELIAWSFAGWPRARVDAFARDVVVRAKVRERLHPEVARVLSAVAQAGVALVVVSASPRAVVEAAVAAAQIHAVHVVASDARWSPGASRADDTMLAEAARPIPYGPGKVLALRAKISDVPVYAAFGDSAFDLALLAEAEIPVAVRPKPALVARAGELPSLVVAERATP